VIRSDREHEAALARVVGLRHEAEELAAECVLYTRLRTEGVTAVPAYPPEQRGKALIALRIARGLSQKELADLLGVSEPQVSRDEKTEYRGVTQKRYARILKALGVEERVSGYVIDPDARSPRARSS